MNQYNHRVKQKKLQVLEGHQGNPLAKKVSYTTKGGYCIKGLTLDEVERVLSLTTEGGRRE